MNIDFGKIFPSSKKPAVTIRTKRPMILKVDGSSGHVPAGAEVTISHHDFSQLERSDYELVTSSVPKIDVADPTPARPEPEEPPVAWKTLPDCFTEFFSIAAQIAVAREHIELIRAKRKEIFGTASIDFEGGEGVILAGAFSAAPRENPISTLRPINLGDPVNQKLARFLNVAEANATDHLERLKETRNLPMQRLFLECGKHRIDAAEELQLLLQELANVGFEMFSLRLQALGLAQHQVAKLFPGSADFVRYANQPPAYLGGICFGGYDSGGTVRRFSDLPVESSASHLLRDRERLAELKPLLVQARKELAKALKASLPAGLPA